MSHPRVEPLSRALEPATLDFLAKKPLHNVFLTHLIRNTGKSTCDTLFVALRDGNEISGAAYFGRQVVIAAEDDATIVSFAELGRAFRGERMIVGERRTIERYWSAVALWHAPPRGVRERQLLMAVGPQELQVRGPEVIARPARPGEWQIVATNSARVIQHELDYDPRRLHGDFEAGVRSMIDGGLVWVGEHAGRICFFCNAGPRSEATLQLQGIWTPPELRGRGLATAALGAIAQELLKTNPTLSLYVNDFNANAIALYERVGFKEAGELRTILFA